MVNVSSPQAPERRERPRASAEHALAIGEPNINPFGDLHLVQHLSARLAKGLKGVFEPMLRAQVRTWADPVAVQLLGDYRAERGEALAAWLPFATGAARGRTYAVLDGGFVFRLLDAFFGGEGDLPSPLPADFTPAAEALLVRVAGQLAAAMDVAWEPVTRIGFRALGTGIAAPAEAANEPVIVTRLGLAINDGKPVHLDLIYPVSALKPHAPAITAKVVPDAEPEPLWRTGLTRAVMAVKLPVRSVLAEPVISLGRLMELQPGDVIPIDFGPEVPVMVAARRLGTGLVGTANGRAAIQLTQFDSASLEEEIQ